MNTTAGKSRYASIFPEDSANSLFYEMTHLSMTMTCSFRQTAQEFLFKPVFEHSSFHRSAVGVRSKQSAFTLRRDKPNSSMTLAANANIDTFSSFTAHILAVHLRLESSFIDISELFFGNVFDFF